MFITFQTYPLSVFGKQKRSFNSKYYQEYNWLEYSIEKMLFFVIAVEYSDVILKIKYLLKMDILIRKE